MSTSFTSKQLADFRKYEKVRKSGAHNMFMPAARRATGLSADAYTFIIQNYAALKEAAEK